MATLFPRAALLQSRAYGHCSSSQASQCALDAIANFFINGTLPERKIGKDGLVEAGIVCNVDSQPWDDIAANGIDVVQAETRADVISEALHSSWRRS